MRNVPRSTKHNINNNSNNNRKHRHDERINMSTIRVLQHNCARSSNVMYSLLNTAEKDVDIIITQESWLSRDGNTISHAFFHSYVANNEERARTAIYVSNVYKHFTANIRNDIIDDGDVQIIDIRISNETFRIYNVYNE